MLPRDLWNAPPQDAVPSRRWGALVVALAAALVAAGGGAWFLVTRTGGSAAAQGGAAASRIAEVRSDVEPGQRLLEATGGDGPKPLVDPTEIVSGGPPPDGIPPIDHPRFVRASQVDWIEPREPVIVVEVGDEVRAFPLQIMTWHEIVNDVVGGVPISVTFCPLCNTAYAFERPEVDGKITSFGTSGLLYNSNLVMYDRATSSLWPQAMGQAVIGPLIGTKLDRIPAQIVAWEEFRSAFPEGDVLSRDTGFSRDYGRNPYPGYDDIRTPPFMFSGRVDDRLAAVERVLGVETPAEVVAFPYVALKEVATDGAAAVNSKVGNASVVVFWKKGTVSALDAGDIAASRDVGAAAAFSRRLDGRLLEFEARGGRFVDRETGSTWNLLGRATNGPLEGQRLDPVDAHDSFWFDWAAFHPDTKIWSGT